MYIFAYIYGGGSFTGVAHTPFFIGVAHTFGRGTLIPVTVGSFDMQTRCEFSKTMSYQDGDPDPPDPCDG